MDERERKRIRQEMLKNFEKLEKAGMKVARTIENNTEIAVTRIKDWDMDDNLVFEIPANKSYPTNYKCGHCPFKVVMSVWMKIEYEKAIKEKKKVRLICNRCFVKMIKQKRIDAKKSEPDSCLS